MTLWWIDRWCWSWPLFLIGLHRRSGGYDDTAFAWLLHSLLLWGVSQLEHGASLTFRRRAFETRLKLKLPYCYPFISCMKMNARYIRTCRIHAFVNYPQAYSESIDLKSNYNSFHETRAIRIFWWMHKYYHHYAGTLVVSKSVQSWNASQILTIDERRNVTGLRLMWTLHRHKPW